MKEIEIPFGAKDSELKGWEYTIPEGMEAEIKDGKIVVREKESEDERIRKEIIKYIQDFCNPCDPDCDKWIAYLEKQKEQKPLSPDEKMNHPLYLEGFDVGREVGKVEAEQKPVKWSEEDEKMLTGIIERGSSQIPFGEPALRGEQMEWLMNMLKSHRPQPKREWSEEDENIVKMILRDLEWERRNTTVDKDIRHYDKEIAWLKSLRPQPIQLKEAYKEGFQTARHATALAFMNYLDENRPDGKMSLSSGECEDIDKAFKEGDWAKIIRYYEKYHSSWKPSDEQMEHLQRAINYYESDWGENKLLRSLINDLKKRM